MAWAMVQVLVRNMDESVVEAYRQRAKAKGRSLEAELRDVLNAGLLGDRQTVLAQLDRLRARSRPWQPGEPTSTEMIREDRDSR